MDFFSLAWTADPIVNGFIMQSGSAGIMPTLSRDPSSNWYDLTKKLGCGGVESGNQTVDCMRQKPFEDITKATGSGSSFTTPFTPTADDKVVFKDMAARKKAGNFIKKVTYHSILFYIILIADFWC